MSSIYSGPTQPEERPPLDIAYILSDEFDWLPLLELEAQCVLIYGTKIPFDSDHVYVGSNADMAADIALAVRIIKQLREALLAIRAITNKAD